MQALHAGVEHALLAELDDVALELGLGLVVHLLDPGRMDPAVLEELLERQPRDLAPDAVEAREDDRAGRVVDDEVDAGEVLQRADVAALAADDPALHVVGRELDDRHRRLGGVAGGQALHAHRQDVAHAALGLALGLLLDLADPPRGVVPGLLLDLLEQQLLGPGRRHAGRPARARARAPGAPVRARLAPGRARSPARERLLAARDGGGAFECLRVVRRARRSEPARPPAVRPVALAVGCPAAAVAVPLAPCVRP